MIKVGIVGGTGYTGVELLRLLAQHPDVEILTITSRGDAGTKVADMFPSLRGRVDISFTDPAKAPLAQCDCVFFATPNGVAMSQAKAILDAGARIVDLSADFRLKDRAVWEKWYKVTHAAPELIAEAVYGLPEVNRARIKGARLVANPGCYATAVQLALLPLVESDFVDHRSFIADGKSGVSGAGRKAEVNLLFSEASDNFKAYAVHGHRHHPEIVESLQSLENASGRKIGLTFVPHLVPMVRGILATVYARIEREADFQSLYEKRFAGEPFVDVLPPGSQPETRSVRGSNQCRIAVHRPMDGDTLVVLAVEDNLVKGAAGQAVQNMNLMFGFPESRGIDQIAVVP
ncbi:N-acetyl-gamma-glutamyl-phosphate reductase [Usitatibacter palustris]|uniref:N-acetyl-gamma-glutamyl-phosphate reductase n=1 Tax=Usitatibacter palustris TaxID=2732487 RepID=A0A6M4H318_9PROT|nr:N-acetyl-gamma-glutamyl-phosphate reductase [Usitatibacter palustris]QJR13702.1 N-acetyl-gamma-glutamyl-phosphate reductase [Usitatibacter palustris]